MLTDTNLRSAVDALWDKLWSGGLSNPLDAIEQLSFLLFLKRLDEKEQDNERAARRRGGKFTLVFPKAFLAIPRAVPPITAASVLSLHRTIFRNPDQSACDRP